LYGMLADAALGSFCGGGPSSLPPMKTRISPLDKAIAAGAGNFIWSHYTVATAPQSSPDPQCLSSCFSPVAGGSISEQTNQTLQGMKPIICSPGDTTCLNEGGCLQADTACLQNWKARQIQDASGATQSLQKAQAAPPNFAPPVDPDTRSTDSGSPGWPPAVPGYCEPSAGGGWCRLRSDSTGNTFERIWMESRNCPQQQPRQNQPPPPPCQYIYHDERYVFLYGETSQSIDKYAGNLSDAGDSKNYPVPMHIVINDRNLSANLEDLPPAGSSDTGAIQKLQFLAVAYRGATADRWLKGARVSPTNVRSALVFGDPSQDSGIFSYAQSQVYNPTSWDLYTQDWHAKLVPASMIEQPFAGGRLQNFALPIIQVLNAH
jgi:hypothetical protein